MLFITEIMLTVAAWRKGWKGWVFLPWAVLFPVATAIGASPTTEGEPSGMCFLCDGFLIVVLAVMAATVHGGRTDAGSVSHA